MHPTSEIFRIVMIIKIAAAMLHKYHFSAQTPQISLTMSLQQHLSNDEVQQISIYERKEASKLQLQTRQPAQFGDEVLYWGGGEAGEGLSSDA